MTARHDWKKKKKSGEKNRDLPPADPGWPNKNSKSRSFPNPDSDRRRPEFTSEELNAIRRYLALRLADAEAAVEKCEKMNCPELRDWAAASIAHWRSVVRSLRYVLENVPGFFRGKRSRDERE